MLEGPLEGSSGHQTLNATKLGRARAGDKAECRSMQGASETPTWAQCRGPPGSSHLGGKRWRKQVWGNKTDLAAGGLAAALA